MLLRDELSLKECDHLKQIQIILLVRYSVHGIYVSLTNKKHSHFCSTRDY